MDFLDRFMRENQAGKVDFYLTETGFKKSFPDVYPRKLAIGNILLHALWIGVALFFAFKISEMSLSTTAAASLGGMLIALLLGKFIPLGLVFGGMMFFLGMATLPFYMEGGFIGIFGLSSASKGFKTWYGKKLVIKRSLASEEQFLRAVREHIIHVTASGKANEDTRLFLSQLEEATRPAEEPSKEAKDRKDEDAGSEKGAAPPRPHVDFRTTEQYYKRSLDITEKEFGPDHPDVATILNNLGVLYRSEGDYDAAEPLYKRSLGIREKALGPDHPEVATSLNNLGVLYASKGDHEKAEPLYKRALAIREKELGPNHPEVAVTLSNLAVLYRVVHREKEAFELEKRAEKITGVKRQTNE